VCNTIHHIDTRNVALLVFECRGLNYITE